MLAMVQDPAALAVCVDVLRPAGCRQNLLALPAFLCHLHTALPRRDYPGSATEPDGSLSAQNVRALGPGLRAVSHRRLTRVCLFGRAATHLVLLWSQACCLPRRSRPL